MQKCLATAARTRDFTPGRTAQGQGRMPPVCLGILFPPKRTKTRGGAEARTPLSLTLAPFSNIYKLKLSLASCPHSGWAKQTLKSRTLAGLERGRPPQGTPAPRWSTPALWAKSGAVRRQQRREWSQNCVFGTCTPHLKHLLETKILEAKIRVADS